ncbi:MULTISPECIES: DUF6273 domain-containing protein [unclassified Collinsella]|uniref:DUF6273 domain-containing protein n=1 Tax=unclassified Collinsella TaxID=2637548 RepID=UPI0012B35C4B|nr:MULTISPECIES: DUF6273 domain-containing protein [unclassified Collinsella]MSS25603.1 Flp family type IVb pilin [Collinsella sp. WCA1-178-WT-3 (M2)]MSS52114.1 Flp family type IVb pilin [Collinsella sp. WCA1-178-WT-3 (M1)]
MHAAAIPPRGVARRAARLRGQSIIEYVLIIAVISLVVVFAGPQVSQAVHNQFAGVANTLAGGIHGSGSGLGGTSGGGSGGNTPDQEQKDYLDDMKTVTDKDPRDWTLEDQKKAAEDIAEKGTASVAFPKAKDAMGSGTKWSVTLNNGQTLEYRIIGINHDDLADGSGKAGLTFEATNDALGAQRMYATNSNAGGWEASELRGRLNTGDLWALLPAEIQYNVKAVTKMTDNKGGGGTAGTPSATTDKVFLLSTTEVYGDLDSDGAQYEYYQSKGVSTSSYSGASSSSWHWTRSVTPGNSRDFRFVYTDGNWYSSDAAPTWSVFPAFCF